MLLCLCVCLTNCCVQLTVFMCPDLPDPTDGRVTFSADSLAPFTLNTMATYTCDEGYGHSAGSTIRTCGPNPVNTDSEGTWSGSAPACESEFFEE